MYNRKNPRQSVSKSQMQDMYNALMSAINVINTKNGQPPAIAAIIEPIQSLSFNDAQDGILAATSSFELEGIWKQIMKKSDWAAWQLKRLTQLKDSQQTKIDF